MVVGGGKSDVVGAVEGSGGLMRGGVLRAPISSSSVLKSRVSTISPQLRYTVLCTQVSAVKLAPTPTQLAARHIKQGSESGEAITPLPPQLAAMHTTSRG